MMWPSSGAPTSTLGAIGPDLFMLSQDYNNETVGPLQRSNDADPGGLLLL